MNKRLGAIALAACVCGLLFSGAASARQAADSITVAGAVLGRAPDGTYVQFFTGNSAPYGDGTPFKQITFSGGSNFHFAGIEGAGGNCKLTPANGGVSCTAAPDFQTLPNLWINTTISGALPTAVTGTVVYADNTTGTFTAPITDGPPATYGFSLGAVASGANLQISLGSAMPPLLQFSLEGGTNWHVTGISSNGGGSCGLTPTSNGGSCSFPTPVYGVALNATFTGPQPTVLHGQITYAHNVTLNWAYEFSCHCTKTSTKLTGFKKENHGDKLAFFLKWKLDCAVGRRGPCTGGIIVDHPALPPDLELRQANGKAWDGGKLTIRCNPTGGAGCKPTITGEKKLELIGPTAARANATVGLHLRLRCGGFGKAG